MCVTCNRESKLPFPVEKDNTKNKKEPEVLQESPQEGMKCQKR